MHDRSQVVDSKNGEMSEWLKEHAWKACVGETLPRVRIPLSPPIQLIEYVRLIFMSLRSLARNIEKSTEGRFSSLGRSSYRCSSLKPRVRRLARSSRSVARS